MNRTVFSTPLLQPLLRCLSLTIWKLLGWRLIGAPPPERKFVLIAAPHTSNWDFPLMLMVSFICRFDARWMGKHTLFPKPVGWFMRWLGGIPIDRRSSGNVVAQTVEAFEEQESLILINTPEGTRSTVSQWKTGFYHIAAGANVPVVPAYVDAPKKEVGILDPFWTTGHVEKDIAFLQSLYADKTGFNPA